MNISCNTTQHKNKNKNPLAMDWFSWLSKSGLEPSLTYEYGLAFARNELQFDDVSYFNHEFLQSMGITVAKHRLEILKLASKENGGGGTRTLSGLILALNKTKKRLNKCISKWVFREDTAFKALPEPVQYQQHLRGALLRRRKSGEVIKEERPVLKKKTITLSGPLDGRVQERMVGNTRNLKLSGPLDGKMQEKMMYTNRSPRLTGPLDRRVQEKMMYTNRSPKLSGPIDGWVLEKSMVTAKSPKLSGPLDGRLQERLMVTNRSPRSSGPLDGRVASPKVCGHCNQENVDVPYDDQSLWATLFQDMKPT